MSATSAATRSVVDGHSAPAGAPLSTPLDPQAVVAWASGVLAEQGRAHHAALRLACGADGLRAFALLYAAFRVFDDRVDAPGLSRDRARLEIQRLDGALAGRPPASPEEAALQVLARGPLGGPTLPAVTGMRDALAWDVERRGGRQSAPELDQQVARIGDATLVGLWVCSGGQGQPPAEVLWLARAATGAHQLRDLEEDLALGYVNLPAERLGDTLPAQLDAAARGAWRCDRADQLATWFQRGRAALPAVRPTATRLLLTAMTARYQRTLEQQRQVGEQQRRRGPDAAGPTDAADQ